MLVVVVAVAVATVRLLARLKVVDADDVDDPGELVRYDFCRGVKRGDEFMGLCLKVGLVVLSVDSSPS